jgi:hypothetical protein
MSQITSRCHGYYLIMALIVANGVGSWAIGDDKNAPASLSERVKNAKKLLEDGKKYPKGCSDFVSQVLGVPWESANDLMGKNPVEVEAGFKNLKPGDIVGWKSATGSGHVAIYIGEGDKVFIDVKGENEKPRTVKSYGDQKLYKSDRK